MLRLGGRRGHDHRALPEIVEHQAGQHEEHPRYPDRVAPEMPHIGIERLGAGDGEHDRAHRQEGVDAVVEEEFDRVPGVERDEDARARQDIDDAQHRQDEEVQHHHRAEHHAHLADAALLDREQADQDADRDRQDERGEAAVDHGQALDRGQYRDRRGDHRIAVEQGGREYAEQDEAARPAACLGIARSRDQRQQRQAAALPLIVRAHDDRDIFDRHDQHHRPEDQAEHAQYVGRGRFERMVSGEGLAEGVERARADIAEHDADRAQGKRGQPLLAMVVTMRIWIGCQCRRLGNLGNGNARRHLG